MSDELLNEFIFDSRDHLGTAGAQLLELEKAPESLTALNALMGTLHTIKGNSGFLDFQNLYKLLHHAESLLQTVREQQGACPQKMIDLLLQVLDTVEALLDRLEGGDDDRVDWLDTLNQALSESEAALEQVERNSPPEAEAAPGTKRPAAARPAAGAAGGRPAFVIKDDLSGKVNLMTLKDGQLAEEDGILPPKVEAMWEAGLRGLVLDLRSLSNLTSRDLKALIAIGRKKPERTAFLLDPQSQESLRRVFLILSLDRFMRFFPDKDQALAFIKANK